MWLKRKAKSSKPHNTDIIGGKTDKELEDLAWKYFSIYIRKRDRVSGDFVRCITCKRFLHWKDSDAGHYVTRNYKCLKFSQVNVHAQCRYCNRILNGNNDEYAIALKEKYGPGILDELHRIKHQSTYTKFTRVELNQMIAKYSVLAEMD